VIKTIATDKAPQAIGPYSQGVQVNDIYYFSGQIPIDPKTNEMVTNNIEVQTQQVLANIRNLLESEGLAIENVIKTTIFIQDMDQFTTINKIYEEFFNGHKPARSTVEVSRLPKDALIEIEVIASQAR
jgi:2-iminobutanoate/2-iminopropanoate deaminase